MYNIYIYVTYTIYIHTYILIVWFCMHNNIYKISTMHAYITTRTQPQIFRAFAIEIVLPLWQNSRADSKCTSRKEEQEKGGLSASIVYPSSAPHQYLHYHPFNNRPLPLLPPSTLSIPPSTSPNFPPLTPSSLCNTFHGWWWEGVFKCQLTYHPSQNAREEEDASQGQT